jgi:voltage-gated potassium channel
MGGVKEALWEHRVGTAQRPFAPQVGAGQGEEPFPMFRRSQRPAQARGYAPGMRKRPHAVRRQRSRLVELRGVDERSERIASRLELPVLIAAVLVIPVIVIEQSGTGEPWQTLATVLNWLIWLVFLAELVTMLVVVPRRWEWLGRHPLEVAIVVLTPPFLPASLQAARVLRLLRLLRLVRLAPLARRLFSLEGVRYAAVLALVTALGGGAAFSAAEGRDISAWDGLWWAVTTMTTVGYGDISPQTDLGRVIAMALMVVGIGFIAVITAALAERFVAGEVREETAEITEEVEEVETAVLSELRAITARLHELEGTVERMRSR